MNDIDMDKVRAAAERLGAVNQSAWKPRDGEGWPAFQRRFMKVLMEIFGTDGDVVEAFRQDQAILADFACHILATGDVLVPRADVLFAAGVLDNPGDWLELDASQYEKLLTTARRLRAMGGNAMTDPQQLTRADISSTEDGAVHLSFQWDGSDPTLEQWMKLQESALTWWDDPREDVYE